jgi:hypothetical protein
MVIMETSLDKLQEDVSESPSEVASTWNSSHETLLAAIADRSNCSRWLHGRCQVIYERYNFYLTIPSVIVTALSGSVTMGLTSIFPSSFQQPAGLIVGITTISSGALITVNQFMKTAQYAESHRAAAIAYGKLHRIISSELVLRRDQRVPAQDFLRLVRSEQDRLQEISPIILESVISQFRKQFATSVELEKPEVVGDLEHVRVNRALRSDEPTPTAPRVVIQG